MEEMLLEDQLRVQLHLQDQGVIGVPPVQHQKRPRKLKKTQPKPTAENTVVVDVSESLKNEVEYLHSAKTPISILQVVHGS